MARPNRLGISNVLRIRHLIGTRGWDQRRVATFLGVGKTAVTNVNTDRHWGWVPDLEVDDLPLIEELAAAGIDSQEIGKKFEQPSSVIERVLEYIAIEKQRDQSGHLQEAKLQNADSQAES